MNLRPDARGLQAGGVAAVTPPRLSLAERDRRYGLVRAAMSRDGIDVLILPASTARWEQTMADSRYLSAIGGFGTEALTVFGHDFVSSFVFNRSEYWRQAQNWVSDVRDGHNKWGKSLVERLDEAGFRNGTLGIAGLSGLTRSPDGIIPFTTIAALQQTFPAARIADATDLMRNIRAIKSAEEIGIMTHATAIAEAMVDSLDALAPGDTDKDVFRHLTNTLLARGGELPAMIIIGSGPDLGHGNFVPTDRRLMSGDIVIGEVEGRYEGYSGQIIRPITLGAPRPDYDDLTKVASACFHDILDVMKPGATLGDVMRTYRKSIDRHGKGSGKVAYPLMHARGLGDEVPVVVTPKDGDDLVDFRLEQGMVFVLKPRAARDGVPTAQVGDMVVVEAQGGRRLGRGLLEVTHLRDRW